MITCIYTDDKHLVTTTPPGTRINMNGSGAGIVRFNTMNQQLEVFDGTSWLYLTTGRQQISLAQEVTDILEWAKEKRQEEIKLKDLMSKNPALREAHNHFELLKLLSENFDNSNVNM